MAPSIDIVAKFVNFSWVIVERREFFITFNLENDLSALATVIGIVSKILIVKENSWSHCVTFEVSFIVF